MSAQTGMGMGLLPTTAWRRPPVWPVLDRLDTQSARQHIPST